MRTRTRCPNGRRPHTTGGVSGFGGFVFPPRKTDTAGDARWRVREAQPPRARESGGWRAWARQTPRRSRPICLLAGPPARNAAAPLPTGTAPSGRRSTLLTDPGTGARSRRGQRHPAAARGRARRWTVPAGRLSTRQAGPRPVRPQNCIAPVVAPFLLPAAPSRNRKGHRPGKTRRPGQDSLRRGSGAWLRLQARALPGACPEPTAPRAGLGRR
mmetsp:Transcript_12150/g.39927  ORF Transcript_12150/g.39927 Transcript_12150/m.39927 type:complete len:214 (-) Transcript_12150:387-1028(-)|eukprot:scaffold17621_cov95-Isochrysis_galbana.AAC.3